MFSKDEESCARLEKRFPQPFRQEIWQSLHYRGELKKGGSRGLAELTRRPKGLFLISRPVLFWSVRISFRIRDLRGPRWWEEAPEKSWVGKWSVSSWASQRGWHRPTARWPGCHSLHGSRDFGLSFTMIIFSSWRTVDRGYINFC